MGFKEKSYQKKSAHRNLGRKFGFHTFREKRKKCAIGPFRNYDIKRDKKTHELERVGFSIRQRFYTFTLYACIVTYVKKYLDKRETQAQKRWIKIQKS